MVIMDSMRGTIPTYCFCLISAIIFVAFEERFWRERFIEMPVSSGLLTGILSLSAATFLFCSSLRFLWRAITSISVLLYSRFLSSSKVLFFSSFFSSIIYSKLLVKPFTVFTLPFLLETDSDVTKAFTAGAKVGYGHHSRQEVVWSPHKRHIIPRFHTAVRALLLSLRLTFSIPRVPKIPDSTKHWGRLTLLAQKRAYFHENYAAFSWWPRGLLVVWKFWGLFFGHQVWLRSVTFEGSLEK